jgi:septum formation protein
VSDPVKLARMLARMKAEDVAGRLSKGEDALVIGADTLVSFQGRVIGKAGSVEEARETLKSYAGKEHEQITGVCIINTRTGKAFEGHDVSRVACRDMGEALDDYISTGEPMDGAGCYSPRAHPFLFEHVDGSWTNIVGLPMGRFVVLLGEALRG